MNIQHIQPVAPSAQSAPNSPSSARAAFDAALDQAQIKLSSHAEQRISRRGLTVDAEQAQRLAGGIDKAAAKGSQTSLVLMDELALLVRVPERTVVTAMAQGAMRDGVVTQIDSAVVV